MKFLLIVAVCSFSFCLNAQFEEGIILEGEVGEMHLNNLNSFKTYGGELSWFITENASLNYNISGGNKYVHMPASVPFTIKLLSLTFNEEDDEAEAEEDSSNGSFKWSALMALIIPEGVTGHFRLGRKSYLSPSIRPLGFEVIGYDVNNKKEGWYLSNNIGLKFEQFIDRNWFVSLYGSLKSTIWKDAVEKEDRDWRRGCSFGLKIGRVIHRN